jgi:hypothetical protein
MAGRNSQTELGRRGIVVASKIKHGFKLRLVAVRKHRNMPPRLPRRNRMKAGRGWGILWRGWLQRFRSGRSGEVFERISASKFCAKHFDFENIGYAFVYPSKRLREFTKES